MIAMVNSEVHNRSFATMSSDRCRVLNTAEDSHHPEIDNTTSYMYRAGVPALHILPLGNWALTSKSMSQLLRSNRDYIQTTISEMGVNWFRVEFVHRSLPGVVATKDNVFVFVHAYWDDNAEWNWLDCAIFLHTKFRDCGLEVGIEIIAPQLYRRKHMTCLEWDNPFIQVWETSLKDRVSEVLSSRNNICAVNVLRLGYDIQLERNPITILITVDYIVNPSKWASDRLNIENLLNDVTESEIVVLFEHGENTFLIGDTECCCTKPPYEIQPGASISGSNQLGDVFSIGPILSISTPGQQDSALYALTSSHIMRRWAPGYSTSLKTELETNTKLPGSAKVDLDKGKSDLHQPDKPHKTSNPQALSEPTFKLQSVQSPAASIINATLQSLEQRKKNLQVSLNWAKEESTTADVDNFQARKDAIDQEAIDLKAFQPDFGELFMTNQMCCAPENARLGYVLIRIDDRAMGRIVSNQLPKAPDYPLPTQDLLPQSHPRTLKPSTSLSQTTSPFLLKKGAGTNCTAGKFSKIKSIVFPPQDNRKPTLSSEKKLLVGEKKRIAIGEFCVIGGVGNRFAGYGDAGAAVWGLGGEWVGVVSGGTSVAQVGDLVRPDLIVYVTCAGEIMRDIRKQDEDCEIQLYGN